MSPALPTSSAAHDVVSTTLTRLHTWLDEVPPPRRRLGKFIAAAAALHVAAFFFILIDNTPPQLHHQLHPEVTLESAPSVARETDEEAYWDRLTDPRLFIMPPPGEAEPFRPAAAIGPVLLGPAAVAMPPPASEASNPFLSQPVPSLAERAIAALRPSRQPFAYKAKAAPIARATTWQWDAALRARSPSNMAKLPAPVSDTAIAPTRLRVAITPEGTVSDVLLDDSSEKPELDQQAILAAQKVRFQPVSGPGLAWGLLTVSWYYTPSPQEAAPAPAPLAP